jgi:putative phosphoribosyl transferase
VVFAHGSGGSKRSPGNRITAALLTGAGFATLLVDLLADAERDTLRPTPDAVTLSERVAAAAEWVTRQPETAGLPVGYFGANTGGAAVLIAAARHPALVSAVVCRGGRTDLARDDLAAVRAPTLLISGWEDEPVFDWNQAALGLLTCTKQLAAVPGATHSFAEPGAVEKVAELARDWFERHLPNVLRAGAEVVG